MITLHQFQQDAVAEIERHIAKGRCKLLLVAPTGSGKTVIASELIRRWVAQYRRILFLAHRREIIDAIDIAFFRDNAVELRHSPWMSHDGRDLVPSPCQLGKDSRSGIASRTDQSNLHHLPPARE